MCEVSDYRCVERARYGSAVGAQGDYGSRRVGLLVKKNKRKKSKEGAGSLYGAVLRDGFMIGGRVSVS